MAAGGPLPRLLAICCMALAVGVPQAWAEEGWWSKIRDYVGAGEQQPPLRQDQVIFGLKTTVAAAADHATARLGHYNGFAEAQDVRVKLPRKLEKARHVLEHFGLSARFETLELQMNRAAEDATPLMRPLIGKAIAETVFENPPAIVAGPDDAATQYFRAASEAKLRMLSQPTLEKCLKESGAQETMRIIKQTLAGLPMAPKLNFDMTAYVAEETLEGIYQYMAEREGEIRHNPSLARNEIVGRLFAE
jgi:hypothetical protein